MCICRCGRRVPIIYAIHRYSCTNDIPISFFLSAIYSVIVIFNHFLRIQSAVISITLGVTRYVIFNAIVTGPGIRTSINPVSKIKPIFKERISGFLTSSPRIIHPHHRIILTICEHIVPEEGTCGGVAVGVEEAADGGVVVARLEIVEPGVAVVVVAAVEDGIDEGYSRAAGYGAAAAVGCRYNVTPGVVLVVRHDVHISAYYRYNVALQVGDIVIHILGRAVVVYHGIGSARGVVDEVQRAGDVVLRPLLYRELSSVVVVIVGYAVDGLCYSQPVAVV